MSDSEQVIAWARANPEAWIHQVFGVDMWPIQAQILKSFLANKVTVVPSCHASGKSWVAAYSAIFALMMHPMSKVVTTAVTFSQVEKNVWQEIRMAFAKHNHRASLGLCPPLGVQPLNTELKIAPGWMAWGLSTDAPGAAQGIHAENKLFIIADEGDAITEDKWSEWLSNMSTGDCHLLVIGNPVDKTSRMSTMAGNPDNEVIKISAFDTPNFTTFGIVESDIASGAWKTKVTANYPAPWLIVPDYAATTYADDGPESIAYQSRVLAVWPESSEDGLIKAHWLQAAFELWPTSAPGAGDRASLGLDVARYGADQSVVAVYRGKRIWISDSKGQLDSPECADMLLYRAHQQYTEVRLNNALMWRAMVDVAGVGAGVYDILKKRGPVTAMDNAQRAKDPERFVNARAENYWHIREALRNGEIALSPHDRSLNEELSAIRYKVVRGRIQIEEKEGLKRRLKRSPDRADAAVLAYACGGEKSQVVGFLEAMRPRA